MAKKKATKRTIKKVTMKPATTCTTGDSCGCKGILALIIIVLTWWKPAEMWSQIAITVIAAIILLAGSNCCKK